MDLYQILNSDVYSAMEEWVKHCESLPESATLHDVIHSDSYMKLLNYRRFSGSYIRNRFNSLFIPDGLEKEVRLIDKSEFVKVVKQGIGSEHKKVIKPGQSVRAKFTALDEYFSRILREKRETPAI